MRRETSTTSTTTATFSGKNSVSKRKLSSSPTVFAQSIDKGAKLNSEDGYRLVSYTELCSAVQMVGRCHKCFGPLTVSENLSVRRELVSRIAIECNRPECNSSAYITDSYNDAAKKVNTMSILRMIDRARAGLETFLSFMNLPPPVTWHGYSAYMEEIARASLQQARKIREAASEHLHDMHGVKKDDLLDITVTCDGTWSKRGFTAMYGVVVVASWETGF